MRVISKAMGVDQSQAAETKRKGTTQKASLFRIRIGEMCPEPPRRLTSTSHSSLVARHWLLGTALFLVTTHSPLATAQTEAATIAGRVSDPSGAVLPGAVLRLVNIDRGTETNTKTNGSGIYVIPSVQAGRYRIEVEHSGFKVANLVGLTVNVQDNLEENFRLEVGSVSESVTVNANGVNINTTDGAVSTVIDRQFVENMPLNGRSFQDLLTLTPGVTLVGNAGNGGNTGPGSGGEISVNGQRTEANYFTVDGVGANVGAEPGSFGLGTGYAGATPGVTALGTTQTMISVDALQEFRATTSTYSAEYGRTPGGQFSFATRSGANDWHGSAYDYFRNEALDANNYFLDETNQPREKERQNDFGGTLGGPVIIPRLYNGKDKTFFFFSYEGLRLWTPQGIQTGAVPDETLRTTAPHALQPLLNAFPLPNAGEDGLNDGLGLYSVGISFPSAIDSIGLRIDQNFGKKLKLFGRYADTPTATSSYNYAIKANTIINNRLLTAGTTFMISPQQANELRFNITQNDVVDNTISTDLGGATPLALNILPGPNGSPLPASGAMLDFCFCYGDGASGFIAENRNAQRQYNVTDMHRWGVGRHYLTFGVDWRRLSTYSVPTLIGEIGFFRSEASVLANSVDSASALAQSPSPVEPVYTNFSAFVQDDWKVTPRLSLSFGLRWDVNPAPGNATGPSPYTVDQIVNLATTQLAPAGTPLWKTDWLGFAPRLGVAYQIHDNPGYETVVRGGFGVFYDQGNVFGSTGLGSIGYVSSAQFSGVSFPLTPAQLTLPPPSVSAPYDTSVNAFDPHLKLPYTLQWNVAIEQALNRSNALTVSYLGSAGRRLLTTFQYFPEDLGNPNFSAQVCSGCLAITINGASSDYDALQVQFQRMLAHGLHALAGYTWSHSIDNASSNFFLYTLLRSSSDFDIRHNLQAALTYDVPGGYANRAVSAVLGDWGLDARISVRSALPVNIIGTETVDSNTYTYQNYNPNVVPGQPLYLYGPYPGGRIINYDAFVAAPPGVEGDAGRNSARGLGAWQTNLALRRDFPIHERLRLQLRAEAFNVFNHPNFGPPLSYLGSGPCGAAQPGQQSYCFGIPTNTLNTALGGLNALYQIGGPRSLQVAMKLIF